MSASLATYHAVLSPRLPSLDPTRLLNLCRPGSTTLPTNTTSDPGLRSADERHDQVTLGWHHSHGVRNMLRGLSIVEEVV
jgi:hypothetical protein